MLSSWSRGSATSIDRQALNAYRHRLRDLEQEIAEAESGPTSAGWTPSARERDALVHELARAAGLGGRLRTAGSSQERARVAVQKAISTAVDHIAAVDEPLARHLKACLHTGMTCSYDPDPEHPVDWVLD